MRTFRSFFAVLCCVSFACQAQVYRVSRLPKPRTGDVIGFGINDSGTIVIAFGDIQFWLLDPDGTLTLAPYPEGVVRTNCYKMNQKGQCAVTGAVQPFGDPIAMKFDVAKSSQFVNVLSGSVQSYATSIDDSGNIVGPCGNRNLWAKAFMTHPDGSVEELLDYPGYDAFTPYDINNNGLVVGRSGNSVVGDRAVAWTRNGGTLDIGTPPNSISHWALLCNDDDMIVGTTTWDDLFGRLAVWEPGKPSYVIEGPERGMTSTGLNGHGDSGGEYYYTGYNNLRGMVWIYGWPRARWIEDMLDETGIGWKLIAVFGPNNKGQLASGGWFNGAAKRDPVLLTPHSYNFAPSSLTLRTGAVSSGSVSDLSQADGVSLQVRRFFVPSLSAPAVSFNVSAQAPLDTLYLWLKVRARCNGLGTLRVSLWDKKDGAWDTKCPMSMSLGTEWKYGECIAKRNRSRYVGTDGVLKAKIEVWQTGIDPGFAADFDQASFEVVPAGG